MYLYQNLKLIHKEIQNDFFSLINMKFSDYITSNK